MYPVFIKELANEVNSPLCDVLIEIIESYLLSGEALDFIMKKFEGEKIIGVIEDIIDRVDNKNQYYSEQCLIIIILYPSTNTTNVNTMPIIINNFECKSIINDQKDYTYFTRTFKDLITDINTKCIVVSEQEYKHYTISKNYKYKHHYSLNMLTELITDGFGVSDIINIYYRINEKEYRLSKISLWYGNDYVDVHKDYNVYYRYIDKQCSGCGINNHCLGHYYNLDYFHGYGTIVYAYLNKSCPMCGINQICNTHYHTNSDFGELESNMTSFKMIEQRDKRRIKRRSRYNRNIKRRERRKKLTKYFINQINQ
jgi:hypothetical protein